MGKLEDMSKLNKRNYADIIFRRSQAGDKAIRKISNITKDSYLRLMEHDKTVIMYVNDLKIK